MKKENMRQSKDGKRIVYEAPFAYACYELVGEENGALLKYKKAFNTINMDSANMWLSGVNESEITDKLVINIGKA